MLQKQRLLLGVLDGWESTWRRNTWEVVTGLYRKLGRPCFSFHLWEKQETSTSSFVVRSPFISSPSAVKQIILPKSSTPDLQPVLFDSSKNSLRLVEHYKIEQDEREK